MATKKLSIALAALTTPTFGFMVTMPSFTLGATLITATGAEINYLVGVTSAIQAQITAKLASASYTAADVLAKLLTVDGAGSGVDADTLDGVQGALYARLASPTFTGTPTGAFVGSFSTADFSILQESGKLTFKYGATVIATLSSTGEFAVEGTVKFLQNL
jgi:hypothetical protein